MNVIICGAGEIGSHSAQVLAEQGHRITVIDRHADTLRRVEDEMDVATLIGNAAQAEVLVEAGTAAADLVVAATDEDEVNLLCASLAKGIGAAKSIARVHHASFFQQRGLDYQNHLDIDRLICPEYAAALAIARTLRNPGAVTIETFARGRIEMQEFTASKGGSAVGKRLMDVRFPSGARLALVRRKNEAFIPQATTVITPGDQVILVGNADVFEDARKRLHDAKGARKRIVIMGGGSMSVWLCRSLRDRDFAVRLFENERERAEELAEKLGWVTLINADPTQRSVFDEEGLGQADVFISLLDSDEANIIAGVLAKTHGVPSVLTVVHKSKYLDLVYDVGIDQAFSTRATAATEIDEMLDDRPLRLVGTLAEGLVDVFRVRVGDAAPIAGRPLREVNLSPDWVVAAIEREREAFVPGADDFIKYDDTVLLVGRHGTESTIKTRFAVK